MIGGACASSGEYQNAMTGASCPGCSSQSGACWAVGATVRFGIGVQTSVSGWNQGG